MDQWTGVGRRLIAVVAIVGLIACGKKTDGGSGGASGSATTPQGSATTPQGSATTPQGSAATPTGPTVGSGEATITLPAGVDASKITVVAKPPTELPAAAAPYKPMLEKHFKTLRVVELGPDGTQLPASGVVTVTLDPTMLPAGRSLSEVVAMSVSADGTLEQVPLTATGTNQVKVEVKHFSWLLFIMTTSLLVVSAGFVAYVKGASDSIVRKNCSDWITPDSPRVAEIAKDESAFSIDKAAGTIHLSAPLKGKDVDQGAHMLKADQVLERGVGDCVNMSTVLASLLAAKGYPVKLVAGGAHYKTTDGKEVQGLHQWAETVIDGKPYYVDTFNPSQMKLIPLHEATANLNLARGRMCGKDGGGNYDAHWYDAHEAGPGDDWVKLETELADLKDQHRTLNEMCIKSPTHNACSERKKVYDRAIALREKIEALKKAEATPK